MMSYLKQIVKGRVGGPKSQQVLEWVVMRCETLMGIGAGAAIDSSGELLVLRSLCRSAASSITILDVGANVGEFTRAALEILTTKQVVIHAFEPGRTPFAVMTDRFGRYANVHLNHCALSSQLGTATLHYDREGSGGGVAHETRLPSPGQRPNQE